MRDLHGSMSRMAGSDIRRPCSTGRRSRADFCRRATNSRSPVIGPAYAFVCVACFGCLFWHIGGFAGRNLTNKRRQEAAWRRVPAHSFCVVWREGATFGSAAKRGMKMNTGIWRALQDAFAQPRFARRCLARGGLFALLVVPFMAVDRAEAACASTAPVNNITITCTGATIDANGTDGYGTNSDKGNTYNILSGASVTGTNFGLRFNDLERSIIPELL
jgi:hypothetical protein